ncbi:MAG TPA: helix-turn-helix domain-containing protein, partial [Thermoanaerobaculia bacterium]|nr:helix-turn-helix domain-containing protein [Thermoanaerobaculia bacterium]
MRSKTVADIRQRFVEGGLGRALERKGPDEPPRRRKLDGAGEARLIAMACGEPPEGRARWTLRLLAGQLVELAIV